MADRCPECSTPSADFVAYEKWPAVLAPERCWRCGALVAYRLPIESITGKPNALFERRRVAP